MSRGLNGWSYSNVIDFLREKGFSFSEELEGSHEAWIRVDESGEEFVVEVNVLQGGKTYSPRTIFTMIGQSGIDRREWRKWATN